jgi:acetoin utilization deacetylase AcuC-like enzyme
MHHGNGTQEIIECLKPKKFGVNLESPFSQLVQTQYQYRPWLDEDDHKNVLFCSIHLFNPDVVSFFPGTGNLSGTFISLTLLENT